MYFGKKEKPYEPASCSIVAAEARENSKLPVFRANTNIGTQLFKSFYTIYQLMAIPDYGPCDTTCDLEVDEFITITY